MHFQKVVLERTTSKKIDFKDEPESSEMFWGNGGTVGVTCFQLKTIAQTTKTILHCTCQLLSEEFFALLLEA